MIRDLLWLKCCSEILIMELKGEGLVSPYIVPFPNYLLTSTAPVLGAGAPARPVMESRTRGVLSTLEAAV